MEVKAKRNLLILAILLSMSIGYLSVPLTTTDTAITLDNVGHPMGVPAADTDLVLKYSSAEDELVINDNTVNVNHGVVVLISDTAQVQMEDGGLLFYLMVAHDCISYVWSNVTVTVDTDMHKVTVTNDDTSEEYSSGYSWIYRYDSAGDYILTSTPRSLIYVNTIADVKGVYTRSTFASYEGTAVSVHNGESAVTASVSMGNVADVEGIKQLAIDVESSKSAYVFSYDDGGQIIEARPAVFVLKAHVNGIYDYSRLVTERCCVITLVGLIDLLAIVLYFSKR